MARTKVLETRNVRKSFSGVTVLHGLNFELYQGEVHALLGENGAGKSTFIKIISGVHNFDSGEIMLNGRQVVPRNPAQMMKLGISTIHQELVLAPHLTVAENICLGDIPASRGTVKWKEVMKRAKRALDMIGFQIDPKKIVSELSVAERQLVAIARALSFDSKVIIMDEPTAALSEDEVENLFKLIKDLQSKGVAFIYISHRMAEIFKIADRVSVLRDGNLIATTDVKDTNSDQLIKWMVGRNPEDFYYREDIPYGNKILEVKELTNNKLDKVSFDLYQGEILGITGLIGAGKTELAMSLFGVYGIESGQIFLKGREMKFHSPIDAINAGISLIPEDRRVQSLFLDLSVKRNISSALPQELIKGFLVDLKKETELAKKYIDELAIRTTGPEQQIEYLSGGNQQKVVLARWLSKKSDVYIFDEPTRGLDVGAKSEIYRIMAELAERGCGVILLSSDLPEILNVSSRVLVMYEGKLLAQLEPRKTNREEILDYAMGNRVAH